MLWAQSAAEDYIRATVLEEENDDDDDDDDDNDGDELLNFHVTSTAEDHLRTREEEEISCSLDIKVSVMINREWPTRGEMKMKRSWRWKGGGREKKKPDKCTFSSSYAAPLLIFKVESLARRLFQLRTRYCQNFPLSAHPGVGQNMALHAPPAAMDSNVCLSGLLGFICFPQSSTNLKWRVANGESDFDL